MKKVLFSVLVVLVMLWSCNIVIAQGRGRARGRRGEDKRAEEVKEKGRGRQADAYESGRQDRGKRKRGRKSPRKMREMMRKGKERFKGGKDITQQLETIQKQIVHENAKHLRRLARMKRIRELALEEGNKDIVKRVDMLQQKEQRRYEHKREILRMRNRMFMRGRERKVRPPNISRKEWRDIKKRPYGRKVKGESKGGGEKKGQ